MEHGLWDAELPTEPLPARAGSSSTYLWPHSCSHVHPVRKRRRGGYQGALVPPAQHAWGDAMGRDPAPAAGDYGCATPVPGHRGGSRRTQAVATSIGHHHLDRPFDGSCTGAGAGGGAAVVGEEEERASAGLLHRHAARGVLLHRPRFDGFSDCVFTISIRVTSCSSSYGSMGPDARADAGPADGVADHGATPMEGAGGGLVYHCNPARGREGTPPRLLGQACAARPACSAGECSWHYVPYPMSALRWAIKAACLTVHQCLYVSLLFTYPGWGLLPLDGAEDEEDDAGQAKERSTARGTRGKRPRGARDADHYPPLGIMKKNLGSGVGVAESHLAPCSATTSAALHEGIAVAASSFAAGFARTPIPLQPSEKKPAIVGVQELSWLTGFARTATVAEEGKAEER